MNFLLILSCWGDLHAHVVNVMFVLALICLVYAMVQRYARKAEGEIAAAGWRAAVRQALLEPYVWLLGFFIGLFHWTNYWDFVIYYVMGGLGVIYCNYLKYSRQRNRREALRCTALTQPDPCGVGALSGNGVCPALHRHL